MVTHLSDEQMAALVTRARSGDELAFEVIYRRFTGFVNLVAGQYYAVGLEHDDLVQEGRLGLVAAVAKWDARVGVPFAPFAMSVVRRRVIAALIAAKRHKHSPLAQSRLEEARGDDRTLGDVLSAAPTWDPAAIVEQRDELRRVVTFLTGALSPFEATILGRTLAGASLAEAGRGMGRRAHPDPAKIADNALQRVRAKLRDGMGGQ